VTALFLVVSTPRPERPSGGRTTTKLLAWIGQYEASGICRHIYARVGRGAVAVSPWTATSSFTAS